MFEYKKPNCINSLYTDVCLKQPMHGNSKKKTNKQQQQIEIQVNAIKGRVTCKMKKNKVSN